jgi:hypothetical protein
LRPRQQQRHVGIGMRAEPFGAGEPPFAVLHPRDSLDRADVGAAGALGHELRALPQHGRVGRQHFWQQVFPERRVGEFPDQMDRGVGDADRAHQPELGLHELILKRVFGDRRQRTVEAERAAAVAHGVELKIAEGDLFHLAIGAVVIDKVFVAAKAVARVQNRRMLVGDPRQLVEPPAGEYTEPLEMRLEPGKILTGEIKRQQIA